MVFAFQPLSAHRDSIRLVRVQGKDETGEVKCSVRNATLGEQQFWALSHVWGAACRTYRIKIDGETHWIRPNLWSFLTYASVHFKDIELWIDALCIDQENVLEKNQQIPLIGRIFAEATAVICWLHGSNEYISSPGRIDPNTLGPQFLSRAVREQHQSSFVLADTDLLVSTLVRFMEHDYWSRLWVVQELRFARRAEFYWNGQCIEWKALQTFVNSILNSSSSGTKIMAALLAELLNGPWNIKDLAFFDFFRYETRPSERSGNNLVRCTHKKPRLLELVLQFRLHKCSLSHDRVYALLSLSDDAHAIVPDYAESRVSLLARSLATANEFPAAEITECVGKLLNINLEEWVRSAAIAVRHPEDDSFTTFPNSQTNIFGSSKLNLHYNGQLAGESCVIAYFPGSNFCFLLTYEDDSDPPHDHEYFYASFKGSIRPTSNLPNTGEIEVVLDLKPSYLSGCEFIYWKQDGEVAVHCEDWAELHQFLQHTLTDDRTAYCVGWDFSRPSTFDANSSLIA